MRSRRAVRRYRDKPVPRDLFEKALGIACCAPTGSNRQEVRWLVIDNRDEVKKIMQQGKDLLPELSGRWTRTEAAEFETSIKSCKQID